MRKMLAYVFIIACIIVIGGHITALRCKAEKNEPGPVALKKISNNLYELLGGKGANGGFYIGDTAVLVIDAKMDKPSVEQELAVIKSVTDKPVKYLVNTHSDGDHTHGNQFFPKGTIIIAHENCRKEFFVPQRDGSSSHWTEPDLASYVPAITYKEKMELWFGDKKVELWYFGVGHTTGDTVVYFPEEKTVFIGDQTFLERSQLIHAYKGGNSFKHVVALNRMLDALPAEHFCMGHDEMTDREGIQKHISLMKSMQDKIKELAAAGKPIDEIKKEFTEEEARLVEAIFNEIKK
ncbi:MAG: hypothetical protein A2Y62_20825 [Candidatus Fischerbacteria bacterium RBG_13_37_8]|uniref:Metallo-beta-lactamase domain-containing protein n=1 Tax=Candidatus Fischerbacteria bacterium RBG_13_37_8 TaxID=1817863 RepID=A0A1F5VFF0_9BACT|nr:MAG: hypothetical protein A2Y62_20825 [Candidatus Fischerbacteria bacterium RBG_13_37_8]